MDEKSKGPRKVTLREKTSRLLDLPPESVGPVRSVEMCGEMLMFLENF